MSEPAEVYRPGLEGVIAGETAIAAVAQDGLWYRGYDVAELAEHASFEECAYLLLHGELPGPAALDELRRELAAALVLPEPLLEVLRRIPPEVPAMDALRTAVSAAAHFAPSDGPGAAPQAEARRLIGRTAALVAAGQQLRAGRAPRAPRPGLSHAGQLLYLLTGRVPEPPAERLLNVTLILYAEHELNASTFVARICASTLSDLHSAVVAAIGALKGPLHGGANEEAIRLLLRFGSAAEARAWVAGALARRERIMGFGHRVYRAGDHRARILERLLPPLARTPEQRRLLEIYAAVKDAVFAGKGLHPNLDFPCGLAYHLLGLPPAVYTPLFVAARVSGWCAHILEQQARNRLIRPRSRYTGPAPRPYVPLAQRRAPDADPR